MNVTDVADRDRRTLIFIVGVSLFAFAYVFQGDGWAHHAHYSTIRQLVEHCTFEITPYHAKTGDVAFVGARIYSNKPPGLALLGALPYALLRRFCSDDQVNQRWMTVLLCAVPASITTAMIFAALIRDGASPRIAGTLALAFAVGSLFLPYSGMIYNHALVAACVFAAFVFRDRTALASAMLFVACLSEYMMFPLAALFIAFEVYERRSVMRAISLALGPIAAGMAMLLYQRAIFGGAFSPSYAFEDETFRERAFGAARFHWPDVRVLYWITWQRMRGLFYCCPMFALPLFSLLYVRGKPVARNAFALLVVGYFTLLLMSYQFWTGGYGVGPRFAIPALPFLFLFARRAYERLRWLAWGLIALSIFNMVAVTSVWAEYPANESGPPEHWDPIGATTLDLLSGRVARPAHSTNLGLTLGLHGAWSVLPLIIVIGAAFAFVIRFTRNDRRAHRRGTQGA